MNNHPVESGEIDSFQVPVTWMLYGMRLFLFTPHYGNF